MCVTCDPEIPLRHMCGEILGAGPKGHVQRFHCIVAWDSTGLTVTWVPPAEGADEERVGEAVLGCAVWKQETTCAHSSVGMGGLHNSDE